MNDEARRDLEKIMLELADIEMDCGMSDDPADYEHEADIADARTSIEAILRRSR